MGLIARARSASRYQGNAMKKLLSTAIALIAALVLLGQSAQAQTYPRVVIGPFDFGDARIFWASTIVGAGTFGAYFAIRDHRPLKVPGDKVAHGNFNTGAYALTTVGCMTLSPMLAAAWVWNTEGRPLSHREALGLGADCIVPFLGSMMWNAAYDAHPEWPGR